MRGGCVYPIDEFVVHDIKVIEGEKGLFIRNAEP